MIDPLEHIGLVHTMVSKYHNVCGPAIDHDDLFQVGFIATMKAAETFDPSKGAQFSTWAGMWIKSAMREVLCKMNRTYMPYTKKGEPKLPSRIDRPKTVSLDQRIARSRSKGRGRGVAFEELATFDRNYDKEVDEGYWKYLEPEEAEIVKRKILKDEDFKVISEALNIHRERVSMIYKNALRKLRRSLAS